MMMTREQILFYLKEVGEELASRGIQGELLMTGGASMCLVHEARDMTKDIDALYEPKMYINQIYYPTEQILPKTMYLIEEMLMDETNPPSTSPEF